MHRIFKAFALTIGCLILASAAMAQYTEFIVQPGGSGTTYPNLTAAVATAQTFTGQHRIIVKAGTYNDAGIFIDHTKPGVIREIIGAGKDVVIFQAPVPGAFPVGPANTFLDVRSTTGIKIEGISVVGYDLGIATWGPMAAGLIVNDCLFDSNIAGIYVASNGGLFDKLEIKNGWQGFQLFSFAGGENIDNNVLSNSSIHDMSRAPAVFFAITAPFAGLPAASLNNNQVVGCQIYDNSDQGIIVSNSGVGPVNGTMIMGNMIYNNQWNAVALMGCTTGSVDGNTVYGNVKGSINPDSTLLVNTWARGAIDLFGCNGVTVQNNTVYDNGGLGTTGDGVAYADYGIATDGKNTLFKNNCLFGHAGVEGFDAGDGSNWWTENYYEDLTVAPYALDGGVAFDTTPMTRENQVTGPTTVEVLNPLHVDFNWVAPACATGDPVKLAAYQFTVTYDPTVLEYVGSGNGVYLGPEALYTGPIVDEVAGTIIFAGADFILPGVGDGRLGFADFTAKNTTASTTISVSSDYRDELNNPIPAGSQSLTLAVTDTQKPTGTVVFTDPIGNMKFSDSYSMVFSGAATDNFCLAQVWYRVAPYIGWTLIKPLSGTADSYGPVTVSMATVPEGGPYTLEVLFRDCSSNDFSVFKTFNVDKTGPGVSGLTLTDSDGCADAGNTSSQLINVTWTDDGSAVQHQFWLTTAEGFLPYDNTTTYTLPVTEGTYTLYVQLKDVYGNLGAWSTGVSIILDKTAPVLNSAWVVSFPTPAKTNLLVVPGAVNMPLALYAKASRVLGDLDCGDGGWAPIAGLPFPQFNIDISSGGDGPKTVFFAAKDAAGNVGTMSTTITLDTQGPVLSAFDIYTLTGKSCASSNNFNAIYSYGAADVTKLQWSYDNITWGDWVNPVPQSPDTAAGSFAGASDGWKKVYGRLVDNVGNIGPALVDSLYVDMTPPTLAAAVPDDITPTANPDPTIYPNTTNEAKIRIQMTGLAPDVEKLGISQDGGATWSIVAVSTGGAATFNYDYTWTTPAECSWYYGGRVKTIDCAGNESIPVAFSPTGVYFDFTAPVAALAGPASTNTANVNLTITASDIGGLYLMRLAQGPLDGVAWVAFNANPSFTLIGGDGNKTVNLEVADYGGNIAAASVIIDLDATVPTAGTFEITSANPLAASGYTSTLVGNTYVFTPDDGDLTDIAIWTGTTWMGWYAPAPLPYSGTLAAMAGVPGSVSVQYYLRDDAGNQSGPFVASIIYDNANPPAPTNALGIPGASVTLSWDAVVDAQAYQIRYNFTNQYPAYTAGVPPYPGSMIEGILAVEKNKTTSYTFDGPQDDLFAFGIWTLSKAGLWSLAPNQQVLENNYRLGDFEDVDEHLGSDGCLSFDPEFSALAVAYNTVFGGTYYNQYLDFAPTSDGSATGYAAPNGVIDFEDLVVFAINYSWSRAQSACSVKKVAPFAAGTPAGLTVVAEVPAYAKAGDEFTVPISFSEGAGVAGYHLVFDFDKSNLELISVTPGQAYEGDARSFFYHNGDAAGLDISSAILNDEGLKSGEVAVVTFKTKTAGPVILTERTLDVRDWNNQKSTVSFNLTASGGALPTAYSLSQNYPNPFNPTTAIELALPKAGQYRLTIYNVIGQVVKVMEGYSEAGYVTLNWDASGQASGVYLYKVTAGDFSATRKMMLLK